MLLESLVKATVELQGFRVVTVTGDTGGLVMPARPSIRLMSMRQAGRTSRKFIIGTRLCPPARIFASSPRAASRATASSIVAGAV